MLQIMTQNLNAAKIHNTKIKDKELEREDRHKAIYIGSSHNTGVVWRWEKNTQEWGGGGWIVLVFSSFFFFG